MVSKIKKWYRGDTRILQISNPDWHLLMNYSAYKNDDQKKSIQNLYISGPQDLRTTHTNGIVQPVQALFSTGLNSPTLSWPGKSRLI